MKNSLWKNWFLLLLGLWVMVLPWTGFPQSIKTPLTVLSGLCIVALSFTLARPSGEANSSPRQEELFVDDTFEDTE